MSIPIVLPWLAQTMPDGFEPGEAIVVTGPGGSGKPLIGNGFIASWLEAGGSVVFLSLQYPDTSFSFESFRRVTGKELTPYNARLAFIQLDTSIDDTGPVQDRRFAANVVYPDTLDAAIARARTMVGTEPPGVMMFASALNLLMFSPTYGDELVGRFLRLMADTTLTTVFSVSEKPHADQVARLENAADTLIYSRRPDDEFRLEMEVRRTPRGTHGTGAMTVPIPEAELQATRRIAEHSRSRVIPQISEI